MLVRDQYSIPTPKAIQLSHYPKRLAREINLRPLAILVNVLRFNLLVKPPPGINRLIRQLNPLNLLQIE
jgi:hypothetical protein